MEAILILFGVLLLIGVPVYYLIKHHRRDWIGIWRGKKIQITQTYAGFQTKTVLKINEEEIALEKVGKSLTTEWQDPIHGSISIHMSYVIDSNGISSGCQLVVDGDIVQLVEAPRTIWGRSMPERLPMLKETSELEGTTITDPRFAAAERLYTSIRTEAGEDEETLALLEELHIELIEHILIAERLLQSKADYVSLGNDGGHLEVLQEETESRIQALLGALQDVHLAVVQRSFSSGKETLINVRNVLAKIHAETEVERTTAKNLKQQLKKQSKNL